MSNAYCSPSHPPPPHPFSIVFTTGLQANSAKKKKMGPSIKGREKQCDGLPTSMKVGPGAPCLKCGCP